MSISFARCAASAVSLLLMCNSAAAQSSPPDKSASVPGTVLQEIPAALYDPTRGVLRNPWRSDIATCSQWWGGPVGTILPAGFSPPPAPPDGVHGLVGFNYSSACRLIEGLASASARSGGFFVRGSVYGEDVGNLTGGNGAEQRHGFERKNYSVGLGYAAPDGMLVSFDYTRAERHNSLYGTSPLDTRYFDADIFAGRVRLPITLGALKGIEITGRATLLERENDNFSLRELLGAATRARFSRDLIEGKAQAEFAVPGLNWVIGGTVVDDRRDATRFQAPTIATLTRQSRIQPNVAVTEIAGFADLKKDIAPGLRLLAGVRLAHVDAGAGDLDATGFVTPGFGATPTPRSLFAQYYGLSGALDAQELNLGGKLRLERDIAGGVMFAGLSRQVRTADPLERYFVSFTPPSGGALNPGPVHRTWIGNPGLDPEKHHIAEIGFAQRLHGWTWAGRAYLDRAADFILWDRARGQAGILVTNNAGVFRNVDALVAGVSGRVGYQWASGFFARLDGHLTYGENLTDNRAIGQIPPLELITTVGYNTSLWGIEGRVRAVAGQSRLDNYFRSGSGVDGDGLGSAHKGFALVDLMASWRPLPNFTLQAGVENLFDKTYVEHIERNDIDDPFLTNQIASGRSFVVRGTTRF